MAEPTGTNQGAGNQQGVSQGGKQARAPQSGPMSPGGASQHEQPIFFVLEIANSRNRDVIWPLNQARLRCRWAKENLAGISMDDKLTGMPDVPGMLISISGRTSRIIDPLGLPENKHLCDRIAGLIRELFGSREGPEKPSIVPNLSDDELKSWCYWARRLLDNEDAALRRGRVPEMTEVFAMSGLIMHGVHDSGSSTGHQRESHRYIKPRKEESSAAAELDLTQIFDGR